MKKRLFVMLLLVAMVMTIVPPQTIHAAEKGRIYDDDYGGKYYIYGNGHDEYREFTVYVDGKYYDHGGGWQKIDGKWYFFNENYGWAFNDGIWEVNGKYYYFDVDGAMKTGWIRTPYDENSWYYAGSDGVMYGAGWKKIGGKWYYFSGWDSSPGTVKSGEPSMEEINGVYYAFDASGALSRGGWLDMSYSYELDDGSSHTVQRWAYANADGTCATGWKKLGGKWYYFDPDYPDMATISREIDGKYYLFNKSGALASAGWVDLGEGYWGYANASGMPVPGWKKSGNSWYFIMENGVAATSFTVADKTLNIFKDNGVWESAYKTPGWKSIKRNDYTYWFYINSDGTCATGWKSIGGKWYYFNELSGVMVSKETKTDKGKIYMFDEDGRLVTKAGWYSMKWDYGDSEYIEWYYLNSDGSCRTGWQKIGGKWYYFSYHGSMYGGEYYAGTNDIDGATYYFDKDGVMRTGWIAEPQSWGDGSETQWYHTNASGIVDTGWKKIDGKWYYFGESGGMYTGKNRIGTNMYDLGTDGVMKTGWIKEENTREEYDGEKVVYVVYTSWSYADASGALARGEKTIGGKRYLFDEWGTLVTSKDYTAYRYNGVQYTVDENGVITNSFNYQSKYE